MTLIKFKLRFKLRKLTNETVKAFSSFSKAYRHENERDIYKRWEESSNFTPKKGESGKFSMILPPPNVTGTLHLGHALTLTVQDAVARFERMKGKEVLWVPGLDHAGIATQVVVEREIRHKLQKSAQEIGRSEFLRHAWEWKSDKGDFILEQMKRLGASLDWSKEYFTLDDVQNKSVVQALLKLWDDGLIYRGEAIINWSPTLQTAISDIEVDHVLITEPTDINILGLNKPVRFGQMIDFSYKIKDSDETIVVSTTRVETLFGDVAVAVNPNDSRHSKFIGRQIIHPFNHRIMPIIADDSVDPNFGTGAVKITPAHDPDDFELAKRHNLPIINVIDDKGFMKDCGEFSNIHRFDVREKLINVLQEKGMLISLKPHSLSIPVCSRSKDIIEYLVKKQWFIKCDTMAAKAADAVRTGKLKITPEKFTKNWFQWLDGTKDWCISRQLWWGHQVPFYSCGESSWVAAATEEEALEKAKKSKNVQLKRDVDVLDTWFSSALLPFSTLGWIENENSFRKFYPLDIMITGHDILFFWVARMTMLGLQLTGQLPFKHVLLHSIICDSQGRKMSKSLGNVIDPIDIIDGCDQKKILDKIYESNKKQIISQDEVKKAEKYIKSVFPKGIPDCGADALRFTLLSQNIKNTYLNLNVDECHGNKLFCNKIWQSVKFARIWAEKYKIDKIVLPQELNEMDRWILIQLSKCVESVRASYENYDFHISTNRLRSFLHGDICDLYIESMKALKDDSAKNSCLVLLYCFEIVLRSMAPVMPFISETLYLHLPNTKIDHFYSFPDKINYQDENLEKKINLLKKIIGGIRSLKSEQGINYELSEVCISTNSDITSLSYIIESLAKCKLKFLNDKNDSPSSIKETVELDTTVFLICDKVINKKINVDDSKKMKLELALNKLLEMTSTEGYKRKVSDQVKESHQLKIKKLKTELKKLES